MYTGSKNMSAGAFRGLAALCLAVALLVGAASASGVFLRGDGGMARGMSIRGESFDYATGGVYRWNAQRVVSEGVGWDFFTLFIAFPAMLFAVPLVARGSFRGRLFAAGLLAYFLYQYLEYATYWAYGPLFLLYILIFSSSLWGLVWLVSGIDVPSLPGRFSDRFPRRGMAALCFILSAVLLVMWLSMIVKSMGGKTDGVLLGETTLVVQAYDLGLVIPLAVFTGVMALRRRPWGYFLSSVFVVKAVAMASAICAMLVSAWNVEGRLEAVPFAIFASAAAAALALGIKMYRNVVRNEVNGEQ
jgi:hypothetical protein